MPPMTAVTRPAANPVYCAVDQQPARQGWRLTWVTFVHTFKAVDIAWDPNKAAANLSAHGVSFVEAATVLTDDMALTREDPDAVGEQRFVSLAMSATGALLVVVYTYREPDTVRLISAWKANKPQPDSK